VPIGVDGGVLIVFFGGKAFLAIDEQWVFLTQIAFNLLECSFKIDVQFFRGIEHGGIGEFERRFFRH